MLFTKVRENISLLRNCKSFTLKFIGLQIYWLTLAFLPYFVITKILFRVLVNIFARWIVRYVLRGQLIKIIVLTNVLS
jgi:hypothetical protein